jgi:NADP-dependent 3-hydroxy acid dehydrogenase YdfG
MQQIAFITGATSGIGEATARLLADHSYHLILCGRRKERLDALAGELSKKTGVFTLSFDVRNRKDVHQAVDSLPQEWKAVTVLVNNAGNAHGLAPLQEGNEDDWDAMLDINVKGLLYVTKAVLPLIQQQPSGHIVNIGSIAGKEVYPKGNVYCASKYAVDAINQGLRMDLNGSSIRVSAINPGLVETEFSLVRFKGDAGRAENVYSGIQALQAEDIADTIFYIITRPAHVNIADLLILPTAQASATLVNRS